MHGTIPGIGRKSPGIDPAGHARRLGLKPLAGFGVPPANPELAWSRQPVLRHHLGCFGNPGVGSFTQNQRKLAAQSPGSKNSKVEFKVDRLPKSKTSENWRRKVKGLKLQPLFSNQDRPTAESALGCLARLSEVCAGTIVPSF
jgi:hypothetical protein